MGKFVLMVILVLAIIVTILIVISHLRKAFRKLERKIILSKMLLEVISIKEKLGSTSELYSYAINNVNICINVLDSYIDSFELQCYLIDIRYLLLAAQIDPVEPERKILEIITTAVYDILCDDTL